MVKPVPDATSIAESPGSGVSVAAGRKGRAVKIVVDSASTVESPGGGVSVVAGSNTAAKVDGDVAVVDGDGSAVIDVVVAVDL
jgi:hypothetical protein